ncbi:MAG: hypothetical protein ACRDLK_06800, partial [Gaiellaceae bacterium]
MRRALLILLALVLLAFAGVGAVRGLQYRGAAKPGVHVLGIDVGGKSRAQIEATVRAWGNRLVTVRAGARSYRVPRGWVVTVDARATATSALAAGAPVSLLFSRYVSVAPVVGRSASAQNVLG